MPSVLLSILSVGEETASCVCVWKPVFYYLTVVPIQPPLTSSSGHEMPLRKAAVPAALQSLELKAWQDLRIEGAPSKRLWAEAAVLALGAVLKIATEKTEARTNGDLIVVNERSGCDQSGRGTRTNQCWAGQVKAGKCRDAVRWDGQRAESTNGM